MKNVLNRDFIREIKKNKGRFLSILFIVMLGTAFFSGIRSAGGDMKYTADEFYKRSKMMDIRVISTYGITEDDLSDMRKIEGVDSVTGGYTKEVIVNEEDEQYVLKLIAVTKGVNEVILTSGRLPEKPDECVLDSALREYQIGDVIRAESGTDDSLDEDLTRTEFTIVGFGNLPYYLDLTRGVGTIGNGSVKAFALIPEEAFCMEQYTESYIRVIGADEFNSYSDEYQDLVDRVSDEIEGIENKINTRRYEQVVSDAQEEIDDAKAELEDAQKELDDAKAELDDGKKELDDAKKELEDGKKELDDAKKELEDGEKELNDAKKELEDGEKELADAKAELADAKAELEKGEKELADAKAELDRGEKELAEAKAELDKGEKQLADSKKQLDSAKKELEENETKLKDAKAELEKGEKELDSAKEQLDEAKKTLDAGKEELDENRKQLEAAHAQMEKDGAALEAGWQEYYRGKSELEKQSAALAEAKIQLNGLKNQLAAVYAALEADPGNPELLQQAAMLEAAISQTEAQIAAGDEAAAAAQEQLAAAYEQLSANQAAYDAGVAELTRADEQFAQGERRYEAGLAEYEKNYKDYEAGVAELEKGKKEYETGNALYQEGLKQYESGLTQYQAAAEQFEKGKQQYESGLAKVQNGKKQYEDGLAEYMSGKQKYEDGLAEYEKGLAEFEDGKKEYEDGLKEYEDGKKKYEDGLKEYEDGLAEYQDGLKEYEDGLKEYEDACAEHLPEIEDGWKEVEDAEADLRRLEKPKLYALDRSMIQSVSSLDQDAERMDSLGNVFPVIFFLVAALVSLTAMTRMVDEQRSEIGTLKALGFSSAAISWKYLKYALIPSLAGGVIGVFAGEYFIPKVIIDSYRIMYTSLDKTLLPFNWLQGLIAVVAAAACTSLAAWAACRRKLKEKPASLMRPEAPANGRRVFLEYITPVWKRMSFTAKSTVRNLFRYKKRLFMTIIGIGACMGLIIVGFGLDDSITDVAKRQYKEIFMQEATVGIDAGASVKQIRELIQNIEESEEFTDSMELAEISATLYKGKVSRSAYIYVPKETDAISNFLRFQDRATREPYDYPREGVGLAEKTAAMLGVKVGDTILVQKGESGVKKEAEVTVIVENYIQHYCFMTEETYKELFGEAPDYNSILLRYEDTSPENEERLGKFLISQDACTSVNFTTDFQKQIDDMLATLTKVIWVLLISAGLLAFVVLYNLNNINITERKRELATLKVLGFRDIEVALYVYRENIFLTLLGIVLGCLIGLILHRFTILTVEVDLMMFGRVVRSFSYVKSALITVLFAVIVNTSMFFSLKKIDMIESLKSVE